MFHMTGITALAHGGAMRSNSEVRRAGGRRAAAGLSRLGEELPHRLEDAPAAAQHRAADACCIEQFGRPFDRACREISMKVSGADGG